jgi:hypothetical protein
VAIETLRWSLCRYIRSFVQRNREHVYKAALFYEGMDMRFARGCPTERDREYMRDRAAGRTQRDSQAACVEMHSDASAPPGRQAQGPGTVPRTYDRGEAMMSGLCIASASLGKPQPWGR